MRLRRSGKLKHRRVRSLLYRRGWTVSEIYWTQKVRYVPSLRWSLLPESESESESSESHAEPDRRLREGLASVRERYGRGYFGISYCGQTFSASHETIR